MHRDWRFCALQQRTYPLQLLRKHRIVRHSRLSQPCAHSATPDNRDWSTQRTAIIQTARERKKACNEKNNFSCALQLASLWKSHCKEFHSNSAGVLEDKTRSLGEGEKFSKEVFYKDLFFMFFLTCVIHSTLCLMYAGWQYIKQCLSKMYIYCYWVYDLCHSKTWGFNNIDIPKKF